MPRCPSCSSIVLPNQITVTENDEIHCVRCDDHPSFVADIRMTDKRVQLDVGTGSASVVVSSSWEEIFDLFRTTTTGLAVKGRAFRLAQNSRVRE